MRLRQLFENPNNNLAIIKSLVDPQAQARMAQSQSAKRGGKQRALANLKNAHMFDDPISMVKSALNMGATPEEVAQNLSPKTDLSKAATPDQIAQQRADDPFLQRDYNPNVNEAEGETVGLIFGRFNPPHKGHKAAWEMASEETHW